MPRRNHVRGFTLVEMIVTIVILAIALVGVANMVRLGSSNSANAMLETRAIALGQAYLDEIMGRRFDERSAASGLNPCYGFGTDRCSRDVGLDCDTVLGVDGGETVGDREEYDDVDDYNGLVEGDGEAVPISDAEGNTRADYANFRIEVAVRYAGDDTVLGGTMHCTNAKLITVTVRTRDQTDGWEFSVYKANY